MPEESVQYILKSLAPFQDVRAPHGGGVAAGGCAPRLVSRQPVLERNGLHVRCLPAGLFPPTPAAPCDAEGLARLPTSPCPQPSPQSTQRRPLPPVATSVQLQPRRAELWAAPLLHDTQLITNTIFNDLTRCRQVSSGSEAEQ